MIRRLATVAILCLGLVWLAGVADVLAKSGGGGFRSGGRATREEDRSFRSDSDADNTFDGSTPEAPEAPKKPKKAPTWRSVVRGLLTGGLIGSIFFGRSFGGIGLFEVLFLSGLIALAYWGLSKYHLDQAEQQLAAAGGYGGGTGVLAPPSEGVEVEPMRPDPPIDTTGLTEAVASIFRRVQAAWTARDIAQASDVLTVQMRERLDRECARLRAVRRINRVERITMGPVTVTGARQEGGWDRVTVQIAATLVDYTTDEVGLKVLEGNPFDPVPFEERWELVRPSGSEPWRVSAIQ